MKKKLIVWKVLFAVGFLMVIFRMNLSRYFSDDTALLVGGCLLALLSGTGIMIELSRCKAE